MGGLVDALAAGLDVRTGDPVQEHPPDGRRVRGSLRPHHGHRGCGQSSLCRPPLPLGCWASWRPAAAAELAAIEYASMAVVTLAFRLDDMVSTDASGFLVPPVDGRRIKASTFSFAKWQWVGVAGAAAGVVHLRTSIGRHREESVAPGHRRGAGRRLPGRPARGDRSGCDAGRHPRAALGWRAAAVRRRAPGPGCPDPSRRRPRARPCGLRCGVRRGRHRRGDRFGPPGGGRDRRGTMTA